MPRRRFQPAWRLGRAAYWFVRDGGWSARYPREYSVTVSTSPGLASRGGATGNAAKKTNPIRAETSMAFRKTK